MYLMSSVLKDTRQYIADNCTPEVSNVHLLCDVRRREVNANLQGYKGLENMRRENCKKDSRLSIGGFSGFPVKSRLRTWSVKQLFLSRMLMKPGPATWSDSTTASIRYWFCSILFLIKSATCLYSPHEIRWYFKLKRNKQTLDSLVDVPFLLWEQQTLS